MKPTLKAKVQKQIKARRELVFDAWRNPDLLARWYAPDSLTVPSLQIDFRVGGHFRIDMSGEMRGRQTAGNISGTYQEIVLNERIVFTFKGTWQDSLPETRVTVEFRDIDGGTEVILIHEKFLSEDDCEGHRFGWVSTLEKLSSLMTRRSEVL